MVVAYAAEADRDLDSENVSPRSVADEVWGYLRSQAQALPLEPGRMYRVGRKPDSDLVLQVRRAYLPARRPATHSQPSTPRRAKRAVDGPRSAPCSLALFRATTP